VESVAKINRLLAPSFYARVEEVKNQWLEKNVDLDLLAERIRLFFSETDFETTAGNVQQGHIIEASVKIPKLNLTINVAILGQPDDFVIEFSTGRGGYLSPSVMMGYLTAMFGGGHLISRAARKQETLDMLEKDFWKYAQIQVADLADSATRKESRSNDS